MKRIGEMNRKELLSELGRWMKKVEDQQKEISKLREQVKTSQEGAVQLGRIVDTILIEVVKKFGVEVGNGVFEAVINQPKVEEKPVCALMTEKDEDKKTYILRVVPIKEEKK